MVKIREVSGFGGGVGRIHREVMCCAASMKMPGLYEGSRSSEAIDIDDQGRVIGRRASDTAIRERPGWAAKTRPNERRRTEKCRAGVSHVEVECGSEFPPHKTIRQSRLAARLAR